MTLTVNGKQRDVSGHSMRRLLDVLRVDLGLTGTKEGCGEGECGACSVMVDGKLVNSCLVPVLDAQGCEIVTIEGASDDIFRRLQESFLETGAAQCGICTPGMLMASWELLRRVPKPTLDEIREGLAGNLCRCTGYMRIFEAVQKASEKA